MKQNKLLENRQKATARSLEFTHSVIEKSKKLRTPSVKVDKIGTVIGGLASAGLLIGGTIQICNGKSLWGWGTLSFGAITLLSNRLHYIKIKNKK